ncbi:hypothetical protein V8D89_009389, partial [Ganoderma adspersum]
MLDDFIVDKRGFHRRVAARNPLKHRVFTPTAIFTPFSSDTTTTTEQPPDGWQEGRNAVLSGGNVSHVAASKAETRDYTVRRSSLYHPVNIVVGGRAIKLGLGKFSPTSMESTRRLGRVSTPFPERPLDVSQTFSCKTWMRTFQCSSATNTVSLSYLTPSRSRSVALVVPSPAPSMGCCSIVRPAHLWPVEGAAGDVELEATAFESEFEFGIEDMGWGYGRGAYNHRYRTLNSASDGDAHLMASEGVLARITSIILAPIPASTPRPWTQGSLVRNSKERAYLSLLERFLEVVVWHETCDGLRGVFCITLDLVITRSSATISICCFTVTPD